MNLEADNKLEQKQQVTSAGNVTNQSVSGEKKVGVDTSAPSNHFHIKVDATKNVEEQKLAVIGQIKSQLANYDGKGNVTVHREIATKQIDRSDTEGQMAFSFQKVTVDRLREHITREVHKQTNAIRISTNDEIKMVHPEQRQANETKPVLEKDTGKQNNITANATDSIKKDDKQIEQVKKKMKR